MEKKLQNDISIKDEGRLINAGYKLTPDTQTLNFSFDTKAIPCMVCGVEETSTFSQVELTTSIRDYLGNNRLCVDSKSRISLPSPDIGQQLFIYSSPVGVGEFRQILSISIPAGKVLYITGVTYSNSTANDLILGLNVGSSLDVMFPTLIGTFGRVYAPKQQTTSLFGGVLGVAISTSIIQLTSSMDMVFPEVSLYGFIQ